MRGGDEQVLDEVPIDQLRTSDTLSSAALGLVLVKGQPLGETLVGNGDDDLLLLYEVGICRVLELALLDLRPSPVPILLTDLADLVLDDSEYLVAVGEQVLVIGDLLLYLGQFIENLLGLELGQTAELHVDDGIRLYLREAERLLKFQRGHIVVLALLDDPDDLVDVLQADLESEQDMRTLLGLP